MHMLIFQVRDVGSVFRPGPAGEGARARPSDLCDNSGGMSQRELGELKANDGPATVRESKYGDI
jgi:hypothetical protein